MLTTRNVPRQAHNGKTTLVTRCSCTPGENETHSCMNVEKIVIALWKLFVDMLSFLDIFRSPFTLMAFFWLFFLSSSWERAIIRGGTGPGGVSDD